MNEAAPCVVILAGPNGSGKTTSSRAVLAETLGVRTFVNADILAQGLSGFDPESVAFEAGRICLQRMHSLAEQRASFAFETTLASRSLAPWLQTLRSTGYQVDLIYFWLRNPELAVTRVALRVSQGGHHIPEVTIRQRYQRSIHNFFRLYRPLLDSWRIYDNSAAGAPELVASGGARNETIVREEIWAELVRVSSELAHLGVSPVGSLPQRSDLDAAVCRAMG